MLLTDKITEALDHGECLIGVFLDFSKAFDTVDHAILWTKLRKYGMQGVELQWLVIIFLIGCNMWHIIILNSGGKDNMWCSPGFYIRSPIVSLIYQWPSQCIKTLFLNIICW